VKFQIQLSNEHFSILKSPLNLPRCLISPSRLHFVTDAAGWLRHLSRIYYIPISPSGIFPGFIISPSPLRVSSSVLLYPHLPFGYLPRNRGRKNNDWGRLQRLGRKTVSSPIAGRNERWGYIMDF